LNAICVDLKSWPPAAGPGLDAEEDPMRSTIVLPAGLALAIWACASEEFPTQPGSEARPADAVMASAASNTWTPRATRPGVPLFGTFAATATNAAGHSIVYVFGGTDGEGGTGFATSAYDVTTDTWSAGPACASEAFDANGVAKIGNRFYFSGGYTYVDTRATLGATWACDYRRGGLVRKADLPIVSAQGVTGAIGGALYVLPGFCDGDLWPINPRYCEQETSRRFYRYDPAANTWTPLAAAPHSHRRGAAAVLNGKLYVAGGFKGDGGFTPVAWLDVYDPRTDAWATLASLPTAGRAVGAALQGRFFVITNGQAYAYNPSTNSWKTRARPAVDPDALVQVTLDGRPRLLAVGQENTELYTP
jgi:hypothetical protein